VAVNDHRADAAPAELIGEHQSRRASTHDENVSFHRRSPLNQAARHGAGRRCSGGRERLKLAIRSIVAIHDITKRWLVDQRGGC
jgi:hypothetical protein